MYKDKIDQYFEDKQEAILGDISRLVSIQSDCQPPQGELPFGVGVGKALEQALAIAAEKGFTVKNWDHYVGTADINNKETALDILAHLDVVPAMGGWAVTQPYTPLVKDGKIYGRGTADDKGPAVCALYAIKAAEDISGGLAKNVRLILGTDEESGSKDIEYYYAKQPKAPITLSPDGDFPVITIEKGRIRGEFVTKALLEDETPRICAISGGERINAIPGQASALLEGVSPEELAPLLAQAEKETGLCFEALPAQGKLEVTATGQAGHAAMPENASNAVTGLLHLLALLPIKGELAQRLKALAKLFPHGDWRGKAAGIAMEDAESGPLTIGLTVLQFDGQTLGAAFDSRCPFCATKENVEQVLEKAAQEAGFALVSNGMCPPHHVPEDTPFISTLLESYSVYTGQEGKCLAIGGGTYVHGIPNGVAFGCSMPGTDNKMHGADEFAVVEDLITAAKIYTEVILRLAGE